MSAINFAPVPYREHQDDHSAIIQFNDNAPVTKAVPPESDAVAHHRLAAQVRIIQFGDVSQTLSDPLRLHGA